MLAGALAQGVRGRIALVTCLALVALLGHMHFGATGHHDLAGQEGSTRRVVGWVDVCPVVEFLLASAVQRPAITTPVVPVLQPVPAEVTRTPVETCADHPTYSPRAPPYSSC